MFSQLTDPRLFNLSATKKIICCFITKLVSLQFFLHRKKDLIKNVFVPDDNFPYPETNGSFKFEWFKWFLWLCYSHSEDPIYCLACVLLGHKFPEKTSRVKNFCSQAFRHWPASLSL